MAAPRHDWYLKQWLKALDKKQSDIVRDLDWNKAKVSLTASGKQAYTREDVNEIADYLHLRPYELLMDPADAMGLRRMKDELVRLAHSADQQQDSPEKRNSEMRVSAIMHFATQVDKSAAFGA